MGVTPYQRPARPLEPYPEISWSGWGDPAQAAALPPELLELVRAGLGVRGPAMPAPKIGELRLPAPRLPAASSERLSTIVGAANVRTDDESRVRHTRGKSTTDLLRLRAGELAGCPDAVLVPGSHDQVLELLALCAAEGIAVVPFGGGTSVVGGLEPDAGTSTAVLALDLRRLNALLGLDEESRVATLEPGLRGPEAEALLGARGYTLGHFPQSFMYATIGGFAATRSSGQASAGYGRFDDRVVALRVATPEGTLELGRAPRSAAGPDLRQLLLGSEGAFGVITALTVEVSPAPAARAYDGWRFESFAGGSMALRALIQDGPVPTVMRLSDELESALNLARPESIAAAPPGGGCLAIAGYEGCAEDVAWRRERAGVVLAELGGVFEEGAGAAWERGRYRAPYLRDSLLDAGALVETLETAAFWSRLPALYEAVRASLAETLGAQGTAPIVMCHISHCYRSGASLYFTVACAAGEDPVAQWRTAKAAASDAILAAGGTITHHHGVGTDHLPWLEREQGALGVRALAAVKRALDPAGVMNPGVLVR